MSGTKTRINLIVDKFEIQELLTAYAHVIDERDFDALHDLFTPCLLYTSPSPRDRG